VPDQNDKAQSPASVVAQAPAALQKAASLDDLGWIIRKRGRRYIAFDFDARLGEDGIFVFVWEIPVQNTSWK
jgi:hypothetical protein